MAVKKESITSFQGYSITRITETTAEGQLVIETYALIHGAAGVIAEYAQLEDAVSELNRMLFPLPGLPTTAGY